MSDEPKGGAARPDRADPPQANSPQADPPQELKASLHLTEGPLAAGVLCRVVSMALARADCPVDRIGDAMLVCDALSAHAHAHAKDGGVAFALSVGQGRMEMRIGELPESGAARLVAAAALQGVGNVLEHTTNELRIEPAAGGGGGEELILGFLF